MASTAPMGRRPAGAPRPAPRPYRVIGMSRRERRVRQVIDYVMPDLRTTLIKVIPLNVVSIVAAYAHHPLIH